MYVVTVLFELNPGSFSAFREAILENAARSREEPGCRQFDVCFDDGQRRCFLYEVYDNRAAFDRHQEMPHFFAFNEVSQPWTAKKVVETYTLASSATRI